MSKMRQVNFPSFAAFAFLLVAALTLLAPISAPAHDHMPKLKVGEKAPDFSLPSADGKTVKLSEFAGHIVLVDFYRGYW